MRFGCIGEKLVHSFSKEIHARLSDEPYELVNLSPEEVAGFLKKRDFRGINVTIPYKQTVIPFLDHVDPLAERIGAVNTIVCKDNLLYGYNTDYDGMNALIRRLNLDLKGKKVLILGTGGTSNTALAAAKDLGADPVYKVSRSACHGITYETAIKEHRDARILINTTPCGMFPRIHDQAVSVSAFPELEGVVDAVYNPLRTNLVLDAKEHGAVSEGGLFMLVRQAVTAAGLFHAQPYPSSVAERVFSELASQKENVVLIGMPGCGKTTVGVLLAEKTGRPFYDADELITEKTGFSPAEWIRERGEDAFRLAESALISDFLAEKTGCVIATGGGAVLSAKNIRNLKMNGRIFFLNRPIEEITDFSNRPLSSSPEKLYQRWLERKDLYFSSADHIIDSNSPEDARDKILEAFLK